MLIPDRHGEVRATHESRVLDLARDLTALGKSLSMSRDAKRLVSKAVSSFHSAWCTYLSQWFRTLFVLGLALPPRLAEGTPHANSEANVPSTCDRRDRFSPSNLPPVLDSVRSTRQTRSFNDNRIVWPAGTQDTLAFYLHDPDGDTVCLWMTGLPKGAVFDATRAQLLWKPDPTLREAVVVTLHMSDGQQSVTRSFELDVRANRRPYSPRSNEWPENYSFAVGEERVIILANDAYLESLELLAYRVPEGAALGFSHAFPNQSALELRWTPKSSDVGQHEVFIQFTDGTHVIEERNTILVNSRWQYPERNSTLVPTLGFAAQRTLTDMDWLYGFETGLTLVSKQRSGTGTLRCGILETEHTCGAYIWRLRSQVQALTGRSPDSNDRLSYGLAYEATFESVPTRNWLLPAYGIELGGSVQGQRGHLPHISLSLGFFAYDDEHLSIEWFFNAYFVPYPRRELDALGSALRVSLRPL